MSREYSTTRIYHQEWSARCIDTRAAWDKVSVHWDSFTSRYTPRIYKHVFKSLRSLSRMVEIEKMLDVGCGTGSLLEQIRSMFAGSLLCGIDFAPSMIEIAQRKRGGLNINFDVADIENDEDYASKRQEFFDVALCTQVLMDVRSLEKAFSWIRTVLRPSGFCLVSVTHPFRVYQELTESERVPPYKEVFPYEVRFFVSENGEVCNFSVPNFNHSLSEYLRAALDTGFVCADVREVGQTRIGANRLLVPEYLLLTCTPEDGQRFKALDNASN